MFLSSIDGLDVANFTLTKKFESIFFVSCFWTSQTKMKTPSVRSNQSRSMTGMILAWLVTCKSIDNAEGVGLDDITDRTRHKSNL